MSSVYSSAASSRRASRTSVPSTSTSVHQKQGFESDEEIDLDALFQKLDKFNTAMEEVQARIERQRSSSSKGTDDIAAATRFRLELERSDECKPAQDKSSVYTLPVRGSSLARKPLPCTEEPALQTDSEYEPESPQVARRRNERRPVPLILPSSNVPAQEVQSAGLPPRTSSRPSPVIESHPPTSVKSHRRRVTISESRKTDRNAIFILSPSELRKEHEIPPLPALSPSSSVATARLGSSPSTPLTLCAPSEDQLRRELESFAMHDGAQPLESLKYRRRPAPEMNFDSDEEELKGKDWELHTATISDLSEDQNPLGSEKTKYRRHKSILKVFQRNSEVDDLLDLYFDEGRVEESPVPKRRTTLSRRMTFSRKSNNLKIPEVPPLPAFASPDLLNRI